MSLRDPKFGQVLKAINNALIKGAAKASRERKEARVQLVAINADEIYKEIITKFSPFKVPGREFTNSDLRSIANDIATDLWVLFKKHSGGKHFTKGQEAEFMSYSGIAFLFDDSKRFIYAKSSKGKDNQEVFRANAMSKVQKAIQNRSITDPTNLFINKHPEFTPRLNNINKLLRQAFVDSPEGKKLRGDTRATNAKLDNIRTRGDSFGAFPANFWKTQIKNLRAEYGGVNLGGTQLGHAFGGQVSIAANLVDKNTNFNDVESAEEIQLISNIPAEFNTTALKAGIFKVSQADANIEFRRTVLPNKIIGTITILLPELKDKNQKEGSDAQIAFNKFVVPELKKLKLSILDARGSPSVRELIADHVEAIFHGKKSKTKAYTTKARLKRPNITAAVTRLSIRGSQLKTKKATVRIKRNKDDSLNLQSLIVLLNTKLHDKIRQNMGKGRSKKQLNYRTGRFAKSARLKQLLPSRENGVIYAKVKYARAPYGVFEPERGDPRATGPGRDPKIIFGRSIRQLLQEEKIITLRRVRVELDG